MSFERIIGASWCEDEIVALRREAALGTELAERCEAARRGYREAMASVGIILPEDENLWEDLYAEWEEGAEYAHDEDDG